MQHLSLRQQFITYPSRSVTVGLKKSVDFIFLNFRDNFTISGMPGQSIKIWDCSGQSGTYGMYGRFIQPENKILLKRLEYETIEYSLIEHLSEQNDKNSTNCSLVDVETQHTELIDQEEIPESSKECGCFSTTPIEMEEMGIYDLGQDVGNSQKEDNKDVLPSKEIETSSFLEEAS